MKRLLVRKESDPAITESDSIITLTEKKVAT